MTLENYEIERPMLVISDPEVYAGHKTWVKERKFANVEVIKGSSVFMKQIALLYTETYRRGYPFFFRFDDDIRSKSFVTKTAYVTAEELITACRDCAEELNVKLTGPMSSSNRLWLGEGFKLTYSHMTGGAQLCCSAKNPDKYIDTVNLKKGEDVYRTLSHRKHDGALGKVAWIGFNKTKSCGGPDSILAETREEMESDRLVILKAFPGMASCEGFRKVPGPGEETHNWRMLGRVPRGWNNRVPEDYAVEH
jgi:hypothetical protein